MPIGKKTVVSSPREFEIVEIEVAGKRRGDDDNARRAITAEVIEQSTRDSVVAEDVGGECQLDAVIAHPPLALYCAGIVDQHVERSAKRCVGSDECLDGCSTRNVHVKDVQMTRARLRRDFARHRVSLRFIATGQHEMRTERTEVDRDLPADPRGRPSNEHAFASDPIHAITALGSRLWAFGSGSRMHSDVRCSWLLQPKTQTRGDYRGVNDLIRRRLANQRLLRSSLRTPADVVSWLGAMQSQDYPGAKWAIGLRAAVTDEEVERAVNDGAIVRTHILRQTWHFVARDDIRWMLALSGPRVNAISAHYYRKMELDERTFSRSRSVFERVLRDGRSLTRPELGAALHRAGIRASGTRLAFLTMRAELDAVICNGPRLGKQFTYALFDERVPPAPPIDREAALANLARRYFTSHGPATLKDYAWWSGLTVRDAKAGVELAGASLVCDEVDGFTFWSAERQVRKDRPYSGRKAAASPVAHLLPNYDEYLIAHKDRHLVVSPGSGDGVVRIKDPFVHHLVLDGTLAGSWTRTMKNGSVHVNCAMYVRPAADTAGAIDAAVARLGRFMECPATSSCSQLRSSKASAGRK